MADNFDVVVIGSGPGGYAAAIRCAQRGATVALLEKSDIGGTCLNRGCIPSKALLSSAHFLIAAKGADALGIETGPVKPDWAKIQSRKDGIVAGFKKGLTGLIQSNKIKIFQGRAIVTSPGQVRIQTASGQTEVTCKSIILATGSEPIALPDCEFDGRTVISSTEALELSTVPASMIIIGGGAVGCELGCAYAAVGCKVTIIEALSNLLPNEDPWVGKLLARELTKLGIESLTSQKVTTVDTTGDKAGVSLEDGKLIEAEKVLVAIGRQGVCDNETIEGLGLKTAGAAIAVNERMETNISGVYAVGDVAGKTYTAHGAFAEAEVAATNATGGNEKMCDYNLIPRAVYTFPEVASVGKNETVCAEEGVETVTGTAMFKSNGRSLTHNETVGQVRVIRNKTTGKIMGITILGASATEMIATARALIGSEEKITQVSFAHPTVSEVLKEAWEDAFGISLHIPPRI